MAQGREIWLQFSLNTCSTQICWRAAGRMETGLVGSFQTSKWQRNVLHCSVGPAASSGCGPASKCLRVAVIEHSEHIYTQVRSQCTKKKNSRNSYALSFFPSPCPVICIHLCWQGRWKGAASLLPQQDTLFLPDAPGTSRLTAWTHFLFPTTALQSLSGQHSVTVQKTLFCAELS